MSATSQSTIGTTQFGPYTAEPYRYLRRPTRVVMVGDVAVGGTNPIRVQSMTTTPTQDVDATYAQTLRLVDAGCEIVRVTTPSTQDARALGEVRRRLRAQGLRVPMVADVHFNPASAMEAANNADKVRINPGNYADKKAFDVREYTDADYARELERLAERFRPLIRRCKTNGVSMRIGTNHGSLSDRIMNRFGDTPEGMVESALEFLDVCEDEHYHDVIFSMKASNPKVMVAAYRLLVARLDAAGRNYPLHLGVTEAGGGQDGRIKSAIGIGSLLEDGLGDTIRVSLTEDPEAEIPVALSLARRYTPTGGTGQGAATAYPALPGEDGLPRLPDGRDAFHFAPRPVDTLHVGATNLGGQVPPRVLLRVPGKPSDERDVTATLDAALLPVGPLGLQPDLLLVGVASTADLPALTAMQAHLAARPMAPGIIVDITDASQLGEQAAGLAAALALRLPDEGDDRLPAVVSASLRRNLPLLLLAEATSSPAELRAMAALHAYPVVDRLLAVADQARALGLRQLALGVTATDRSYAIWAARLLDSRLRQSGGTEPIVLTLPAGETNDDSVLDGSIAVGASLLDGIGQAVVVAGGPGRGRRLRLAFDVLQGAGARASKTEFVACPSCGRTLFDLQSTTARIQQRMAHLVGVKIAVMGCVVNGLGELADADFGYMGSGVGKVNLFVGKECVAKNVPEAEADARLADLIRAHGRWVEPPAAAPADEAADQSAAGS